MEENKGKYKVLIVDDEPPIRRMLTITLEAHDYKTYLAEDGKSALVEATMYNPDVILLDLGLPDMDGIEIAERLREWSEVPIIVISAREQEEDKIKALCRRIIAAVDELWDDSDDAEVRGLIVRIRYGEYANKRELLEQIRAAMG